MRERVHCFAREYRVQFEPQHFFLADAEQLFGGRVQKDYATPSIGRNRRGPAGGRGFWNANETFVRFHVGALETRHDTAPPSLSDNA